ncbi:hypothetical protein, partial [Actinobacillus pleuropneumoniae]
SRHVIPPSVEPNTFNLKMLSKGVNRFTIFAIENLRHPSFVSIHTTMAPTKTGAKAQEGVNG